METASVKPARRAVLSGATTALSVAALVVSSIGLVFCLMLLFGAFGGYILPDSAWMYLWTRSWDHGAFTVATYGGALAVVGLALGSLARFLARRSGERARAARIAVIVGLLGVVLYFPAAEFAVRALTA